MVSRAGGGCLSLLNPSRLCRPRRPRRESLSIHRSRRGCVLSGRMGACMAIQYDEKGKYYTDVVPTRAVAATLQTTTHLLRGNLHVRGIDRLKDEIDRPETFLAVTEAVVLGPGGEEWCRSGFLAVNRAQIVWVAATEDDCQERAK